jgi:hypothetical protein
MYDFMKPIKPTGHGYRLVSYVCFLIALLVLFLTFCFPPPRGGELLLFGAGWLVALGILMRIVSDFLAGLSDIARAIRERP